MGPRRAYKWPCEPRFACQVRFPQSSLLEMTSLFQCTICQVHVAREADLHRHMEFHRDVSRKRILSTCTCATPRPTPATSGAPLGFFPALSSAEWSTPAARSRRKSEAGFQPPTGSEPPRDESPRAAQAAATPKRPAAGSERTMSESPLACSVCSLTISRGSDMKRHLRLHAPNKEQ